MSESQPVAQGNSPVVASTSAPHDNPSASSDAENVVITSHFKMIWLTITALTLCLAAADILLAVLVAHPNGSEQQAMTMCDTFAGMGFGAIFGLISAKAVK